MGFKNKENGLPSRFQIWESPREARLKAPAFAKNAIGWAARQAKKSTALSALFGSQVQLDQVDWSHAMIRRQRKEARSDELPIAKLHLDDVRDILQILAAPDSDASNPEVHTKFIVRDQECDSIETLRKSVAQLGGSR